MNFSRVNRKILIRLAVILFIVAATIIWGVLYPESLKSFQRIFPSFSRPEPDRWILEVKTVYSLCNHHELFKTEFPSEKSLQRTLAENPSLKINKQEGHYFSCSVRKREFCKSCDKNRFLGINGRKVAVFRGTPVQPGPVEQRTDIIVDLLPEGEREDLKKGIPFKGEKEKLQLLEGLNGLIVN